MTERLPDGTYDAKDIEQALGELPKDLAWVVRDGLLKAQERRKVEKEKKELKQGIASFAIALHILASNDSENWPSYVDAITWDRALRGEADYIIADARRGTNDVIPESVRKAVALVHANEKFLFDLDEREDVDKSLAPLGYSTSKIVDDLTADAVENGRTNGMTPEEVRARIDEIVDHLDLASVAIRLASAVRADLKALGYTLPELLEDGGYGYDEREGENRPYGTPEMLPH